MTLADRVAIVTGAGSGLGRAAAIALAREGATVVIADIDDAGAASTADAVREVGSCATAIETDVSDWRQCERLMARTKETFGGLRILVNNAGVALAGRDGTVERIEPAVWDRVVAINLSGTYYCCHFAILLMRATAGGSIINVASSMAQLPLGVLDAYAASKGGVATLTRSMAYGCGRRGIRVNASVPVTPTRR